MTSETERLTESLLALQNDIRACNKCELHEYGGKPMPGCGPVETKLFLVGEAPTAYAERKGQLFVGGTGAAIDKWLDYLGLKREEVYLTNAVKCVLRERKDTVRTDGYGPYGNQLIKCKTWLIRELEIINPLIILTIGWSSLNSLLGKSISSFQTSGYCQSIGGRYYCAMYHPARHSTPLAEDDKRVLNEIQSLLEKERGK